MHFLIVILCFILKDVVTISVDRANNSESHTFSENSNESFVKISLKRSFDAIYMQRAAQIFNKKRTQDTVVINDNVAVPNEEGAFCRRSFDGRSGYCILAYQCLHVMREHRIHGIKVDICTYRKNIPVICCPLEDKQSIDDQRISAEKCQEYHSALKYIQLSTPRVLSGRQCVSSVPMIVGGERTQTGAYPHMAALGWTENDGQINWSCGGTLISEQFVLTAAHCATSNRSIFQDYPKKLPKSMQQITGVIPINENFANKPPDILRLGVLKLNETAPSKRDIKILIIVLHPKYSSSAYYNDIALLKLTKRVRFSDRIRPACLWQQDNIPTSTVTATGWGRTEFMGPKSNDLLKVDLDLLDQDLCKHFYQRERRLSRGIIESQFCAGHMDGGKDTCQGDSGGPVHIELPEYNCVKFVAGVTSFGKFCAASNAPGVYTKIYIYLDWIEKVVFRS